MSLFHSVCTYYFKVYYFNLLKCMLICTSFSQEMTDLSPLKISEKLLKHIYIYSLLGKWAKNIDESSFCSKSQPITDAN